MRDDFQRIAEALDVPLPWLLGVLFTGFGTLLVAFGTHSWAVSAVVIGFSVVISLIGIRASLRPSRPFRLESVQNSPGINTTRRLGLFYVAGGLVQVLMAVLAVNGS